MSDTPRTDAHIDSEWLYGGPGKYDTKIPIDTYDRLLGLTRTLERELTALRARLEEAERSDRESLELYRRARDRAEACEKDAARYRWLRDGKRIYLGPVVGHDRRNGGGKRHLIASVSLGSCPPNIETLDAAIDSAMGGRDAGSDTR